MIADNTPYLAVRIVRFDFFKLALAMCLLLLQDRDVSKLTRRIEEGTNLSQCPSAFIMRGRIPLRDLAIMCQVFLGRC